MVIARGSVLVTSKAFLFRILNTILVIFVIFIVLVIFIVFCVLVVCFRGRIGLVCLCFLRFIQKSKHFFRDIFIERRIGKFDVSKLDTFDGLVYPVLF